MNMQEIYRRIAQKYGVSETEVEEEMQNALNAAWRNPDKTEVEKLRQSEVSCQQTPPTPDEFIDYAVKKVKENLLYE